MGLKYCYVAYNLFNSILEKSPMLTGCYQWIRVFDGDALNLRDFPSYGKDLKDELEKYDAIMVNADPMDLRLTYEIRNAIGTSSSTKIILNQDHAPELWEQSFDMIPDFMQSMKLADRAFATTPTAQALMQNIIGDEKKVWLCPHPCETHVLKRIRSTYSSDHLLVFWHRYMGGETVVPYLIANKLHPEVSLAGYMEGSDPHARRTRCTFKRIINSLDFISFIKLMKEAKYGYEPFRSYSFGRNTCDSAALGLPVIGSNTLFSMRVNYPLTNCDSYDAATVRNLFNALRDNQQFYNEVSSLAQFNSEYFGWKACKERFMEMIQENKPEHVSMEEIDKKAANGELA